MCLVSRYCTYFCTVSWLFFLQGLIDTCRKTIKGPFELVFFGDLSPQDTRRLKAWSRKKRMPQGLGFYLRLARMNASWSSWSMNAVPDASEMTGCSALKRGQEESEQDQVWSERSPCCCSRVEPKNPSQWSWWRDSPTAQKVKENYLCWMGRMSSDPIGCLAFFSSVTRSCHCVRSSAHTSFLQL